MCESDIRIIIKYLDRINTKLGRLLDAIDAEYQEPDEYEEV